MTTDTRPKWAAATCRLGGKRVRLLGCAKGALAIVADGEGARRVVEIEVRGAPSDRAAEQVARTIAGSPLVKTALAGADPNWGRILAAAGRSGVALDPRRVEIHMAGVRVCRQGREHP